MANVAFASLPSVYSAVNIALLLAYARSLLGPVPFGLIWAFLSISVLGALISIPLCALMRREGIRLSYAVGIGVCIMFCGLTWFNFWCLQSASAAV